MFLTSKNNLKKYKSVFFADNNRVLALVLGVVFFCFSVSFALIFQKLLLPMMTSMVVPGTTLTADSAYFDSVAATLASEIQQHGWSSWRPFPNEYVSVNVAILAALYALFGHDPALAIPLNAIFHALGGVLLFLISLEISPSRTVGRYAGIIASSLFVIFPSALNWYGQIHKDGYAIVGLFLVLLIWVRAFNTDRVGLKARLWLFAFHFAAVLYLGFIRPYYLKLLIVAALGIFLALLVQRCVARRKTPWVFFLLAMIALGVASKITVSAGASESLYGNAYSTYSVNQVGNNWEWQSSRVLPKYLDIQLETMARTRLGLIEYSESVNAKSTIDADVVPDSALGVIAYIPRALQVAVLAPFPADWLQDLSLTRMVSSAEMFVIYACLLGLLFLRGVKGSSLLAAYYALFFLLVYGVAIANLGTLYRVRYGFEFILVLLGVIGWLNLLARSGWLRGWLAELRAPHPQEKVMPVSEKPVTGLSRKGVVSAGLIVMILTLLGFLGFFARDVMMASTFGLAGGIDDFFLALMLPMFVVTVFCTPLGNAFVPFYTSIQARIENNAALVQHLSAIILGILALICLVLYLIAFPMLDLLGQSGNERVRELLLPALLILWVGGIVILGNAVANARHSLVFPSAAQLIVPVIAIAGLVLFAESLGVMAVMAGMVVGQILNLALVQWHLKKRGLSLFPQYIPELTSELRPLGVQFVPLLAAAFFTGVALPIDTMLSATLPEGNVSAFNLGTKIVLFISGIVSAAVSTVMLPYFSSLVEKRGVHQAREELSLFLLIATFVSVPASVILFVWAEPIVRLVFERGAFGANEVVVVSSVMQYALIQIPFFVCNVLLLKYATATRHLITITVSALVGLVLNVVLSLILMPRMGAAGIALAASISMLASSALLVFALVGFRHISFINAVTVLLVWILFLTLLIAVHFQSMPSIFMTVVASLVLLLSYLGLMDKTRGNLGK